MYAHRFDIVHSPFSIVSKLMHHQLRKNSKKCSKIANWTAIFGTQLISTMTYTRIARNRSAIDSTGKIDKTGSFWKFFDNNFLSNWAFLHTRFILRTKIYTAELWEPIKTEPIIIQMTYKYLTRLFSSLQSWENIMYTFLNFSFKNSEFC